MQIKTFSRLLIILLSFWCSVVFANIVIKEHPLSRNGFKLELRSYENPQTKLHLPYPDVLIVHGLTYSSQQFDLNLRDYSLARVLANEGFRVWLLDITGYGESEKPSNGFMVDTNYAVKDINAATNYILAQTKMRKINVLGWSWGTITTSRFAAQYPQKINRLVLYAPIIHGLGLPAPKKSYQPFTIQSAQDDFQRNKAGQIDSTLAKPDLLDTYLKQVKKFDGKGSPNGSRRDLFQPKTVQLIPYQRLTVPTLFIAGTHDPYVSTPKDLALLMRYAPTGSCEKMIPGGGHLMFLEKPHYQQFQKTVIAFLSGGCPQKND